jgi:C4-dicarboxylate-specific signal transduction histidine kinase
MLCGNLTQRHNLAKDEDLQGLVNLIGGLESLASLDLQSRSQEVVERVSLREVLNNLRIVIESDWQEIDGTVRWRLPPEIPFMNLVHNSHRAVQEGSTRELEITVSREEEKMVVRFRDSGPGIVAPERLFQPFQEGAAGTGLGLYVSRVVVRSYGGELRFEPQASGSCFAVELHVA